MVKGISLIIIVNIQAQLPKGLKAKCKHIEINRKQVILLTMIFLINILSGLFVRKAEGMMSRLGHNWKTNRFQNLDYNSNLIINFHIIKKSFLNITIFSKLRILLIMIVKIKHLKSQMALKQTTGHQMGSRQIFKTQMV